MESASESCMEPNDPIDQAEDGVNIASRMTLPDDDPI